MEEQIISMSDFENEMLIVARFSKDQEKRTDALSKLLDSLVQRGSYEAILYLSEKSYFIGPKKAIILSRLPEACSNIIRLINDNFKTQIDYNIRFDNKVRLNEISLNKKLPIQSRIDAGMAYLDYLYHHSTEILNSFYNVYDNSDYPDKVREKAKELGIKKGNLEIDACIAHFPSYHKLLYYLEAKQLFFSLRERIETYLSSISDRIYQDNIDKGVLSEIPVSFKNGLSHRNNISKKPIKI